MKVQNVNSLQSSTPAFGAVLKLRPETAGSKLFAEACHVSNGISILPLGDKTYVMGHKSVIDPVVSLLRTIRNGDKIEYSPLEVNPRDSYLDETLTEMKFPKTIFLQA